MRYVLRHAYPDLIPTLNNYVAARDRIDASKDAQIASLRVLNRSRLVQIADRDLLIGNRDDVIAGQEAENANLRAALAKGDSTIAELKKRDINILGLHLDVTCGPGLMVGFVSPAGTPGIAAGVGCVVGR